MYYLNKVEIDKLLKIFTEEIELHSFLLKEGVGSIMFSAPHSVTQTRETSIKWAEPETGVLAIMLNKITGCHVIYKTKNNNDDANYDEKCEYKKALCDYLSKHKEIGLVIDLHELSPNRDILIDIGTGKGNNVCGNQKFVDLIYNIFKEKNIKNTEIDVPFAACYHGTVSSTVARECKIPCVQLEINAKLLCDNYTEYCFDIILNSLIELVNKCNKKEYKNEGEANSEYFKN